jgi:MFS family permease
MLRVGVRIVIVAGLATAAVGLFLLTGINADSTYLADLLPGMLIFGVGIGWGFVPVAVSVMADADESESGLAAGLINTGQQIGGAFGIAILVALADTRTTELVEAGSTPVSAQIMGTQLAWTVSGVLCVVAAALSVFLIGGFRPGQPDD